MRKPLTQKQLRLVQYFEESEEYSFEVLTHRDISFIPIRHNRARVSLSDGAGEGYMSVEGPRWPIINLKVKLAERWYECMKDEARKATEELRDLEAYLKV